MRTAVEIPEAPGATDPVGEQGTTVIPPIHQDLASQGNNFFWILVLVSVGAAISVAGAITMVIRRQRRNARRV